jgi:hypothetical protein
VGKEKATWGEKRPGEVREGQVVYNVRKASRMREGQVG